MIRILTAICIMAILSVACNTHKSRFKPLPMNQMKLITWDLMKASEWHSLIVANDSLARKRKEDIRLYAQVFAIHGVTREQYFDSYKYYESHPIDFKALSDSIDALATREKSHLFEKHESPR
jgi:hypothetical protein